MLLGTVKDEDGTMKRSLANTDGKTVWFFVSARVALRKTPMTCLGLPYYSINCVNESRRKQSKP